MRLTLHSLLLFCSVTIGSCKKYQSSEGAFFVRPGTITVNSPNSQTANSHKISDLWVYVDGQFQGVYPAENTLPIISKGKQVRINVLAGIRNNGISATRIPYDFYNNIQFDTLLPSGKTVSRPFTFSYNANTTFTWTENFDSSTGLSIQRSPVSDTSYMIASAAESFDKRSIEVGLGSSAIIAQIESSGSGFKLPTGNSNVYLEMNYKCNHQFEVGVLDETGEQRQALIITPQENWNKIYVQLADVINKQPVSSKYKIYFRMLRTTDAPAAPKFFLDNVKLLYL